MPALSVADHVDGVAAPVGRLAAACGVDTDALDRVLRLLAVHGLFERRGGGYGHTPSLSWELPGGPDTAGG